MEISVVLSFAKCCHSGDIEYIFVDWLNSWKFIAFSIMERKLDRMSSWIEQYLDEKKTCPKGSGQHCQMLQNDWGEQRSRGYSCQIIMRKSMKAERAVVSVKKVKYLVEIRSKTLDIGTVHSKEKEVICERRT